MYWARKTCQAGPMSYILHFTVSKHSPSYWNKKVLQEIQVYCWSMAVIAWIHASDMHGDRDTSNRWFVCCSPLSSIKKNTPNCVQTLDVRKHTNRGQLHTYKRILFCSSTQLLRQKYFYGQTAVNTPRNEVQFWKTMDVTIKRRQKRGMHGMSSLFNPWRPNYT